MRKRILTMFMAIVMVVTMLPVTAFAAISFETIADADNVFGAKIITSTSSLKSIIPLDDDEKAAAEAGATVVVRLDMDDATASVSAEDKALLKAAADGRLIGQYLSIKLYTKVGDLEEREVTGLNGTIKYELDVSSSSLKPIPDGATRYYTSISVSDGVVGTQWVANYNSSSQKLTFSSEMVSTVAVTYESGYDMEAKSDDDNAHGASFQDVGVWKRYIPLESDEVAACEAGEKVAVRLDVDDATASVSAEDKALVEAAAGNLTIGQYLDMKLYKKVGDLEEREITELNGALTFNFALGSSSLVPNGLERKYYIILVRDGVTEVIPTTYSSYSKKLSFKSNKVSTIAVVYEECYDVWIGSTQFTSADPSLTFTGNGGGTATLDVTTSPYTLTLNNFNHTVDGESPSSSSSTFDAGIYAKVDLNIKLEGSNSITVIGDSEAMPIYVSGKSVNMYGDGSIALNMRRSEAATYYRTNQTAISGETVTITDAHVSIRGVGEQSSFNGIGNATTATINNAVVTMEFGKEGQCVTGGGYGSGAYNTTINNSDVTILCEGYVEPDDYSSFTAVNGVLNLNSGSTLTCYHTLEIDQAIVCNGDTHFSNMPVLDSSVTWEYLAGNDAASATVIRPSNADDINRHHYVTIREYIEPGEFVPETPDTDVGGKIESYYWLEDSIPLTAEESADVALGKDIKVFLEAKNITDSVSASDKALVEAAAGDSTIGMYLDVNLHKQVDGREKVKLTELDGELEISFDVPEAHLNTNKKMNREYTVFRIHDGAAEEVDTYFSDWENRVSFYSDKFSTYALTYTDTRKEPGKVYDDTEWYGEDNEGGAALSNSIEELRAAVPITSEEQELMEEGNNAWVWLTVENITGDEPAGDKALIEAAANGKEIGMYLDVNLYKSVGWEDTVSMKKLNSDVTISFELNWSLINTDKKMNRTYSVIRIHDGVADEITPEFDAETNILSFKTDKFSTYAVAYTDTPVEPGSFNDATTSTDNAGEAKIENNVEELKAAIPLDDEELELIEEGNDIHISLELKDITETVADEVEEEVVELVEETAGKKEIGMYLDVNLYKQIGDEAKSKLEELNEEVTISFELTGDLVNTNKRVKRTYSVIRVHKGEVSVIAPQFNAETNILSFKTDRFSTYAVAYNDAAIVIGYVDPADGGTKTDGASNLVVMLPADKLVVTTPVDEEPAAPESEATTPEVVPQDPVVDQGTVDGTPDGEITPIRIGLWVAVGVAVLAAIVIVVVIAARKKRK